MYRESSGTDDDAFPGTPPELKIAANLARENLLPEKSKKIYEGIYQQFKDWCGEKKVGNITENVMLAYFNEKMGNFKPSTTWSHYSMLKMTININDNVDIKKFPKLIALLKKKSVGYRPKKSLVLTGEQIRKFIEEANDETYLLMKVILIFGISGAMRREELTNLTVDDIDDRNSVILVNIPDSKTHRSRSFTVTQMEYIQLYRKYFKLRPVMASSRRFFLRYKNGKCINQVVGIHKIGGVPSCIAKFLNLPNINLYTGHCFRRSSATLLANSGANITEIKRHGDWKSTSVAEGYIDSSIEHKNKICEKILNYNQLDKPSTSSLQTHTILAVTSEISNTSAGSSTSGVDIRNSTNCTFNFYMKKD